MKKLLFAPVLVIAGFSRHDAASAETTYRSSGFACQPRDSGDGDWWFDSDGLRNNMSDAVCSNNVAKTTWCPAVAWQVNPADPEVNAEGATVFYDDGHTQGSVTCQLFIADTSGSNWSTSTRYSCSTAGGCASASVSFTGTGSLTWTGSSLPAAGAAIDNAGAYGFFCSVPTEKIYIVDTGCVDENYSHIFAYELKHAYP